MAAPKHLSLALLVTLALCCGANGQTTLYVDDDNCPSPGSGIAVDPYCSIQDAIVASVDGDTIEVAPGTYFEAIDFIGKAIKLRSMDGAAATIIDATNVQNTGSGVSVVRCVNDETAATVLDGFTITGGTGDTTLSFNPSGGGMYNVGSSPTIANCIFRNNFARFGAGMANDNSNPKVTNCMFSESSATSGGGMCNLSSSPMLLNCIFSENNALFGAGVLNSSASNMTAINCTFSDNIALNTGGGMSNSNNNPTLTNCTFRGNKANFGGGMYNSNSNLTMINCEFSSNGALFGGGMYNLGASSPTLTNCTFNGNKANSSIGFGGGPGGGMYNLNSSNPIMTNCTFSNNLADSFGSGIFNNSSSPMVTNSTFWGDTFYEIYNFDNSTPSFAYSNVQNSGGSAFWNTSLGIDGGGNIDADPLFVDPFGPDGIAGTADDDLRLMPGSHCIDAGDNDAYLAAGGGLVDLDGKDRAIDNTGVMDTGVGSVTYLDMGAYEQGPCHGDGIINLNDLESLAGCMVGPNGGVNPSCGCSDYNPDGNVDLRDYASYQLAFTGPPTPTAQYQLTFEATWSAATHPQDFPSGAHFSGLIGGTHNRNVDFWEVGSLSSVGIENMAELGSKTALTNEVNAAISAGDAGSVISGSGIFPSPGSVSVDFTATQAFGLVTMTSMLAPSPDWFGGLDSLVLFNHNQWADEIVVVIEPYDAGTDDGVTFTSPNADTNPAEAITQIVGFPFLDGAEQAPLGTFTVTRID